MQLLLFHKIVTESSEYEKVSNEEDFLIFSKTHKSFDEIPKVFVQSVQDWIDELGLDSIVTINTKSKKGHSKSR
jgi:hypothetical protein